MCTARTSDVHGVAPSDQHCVRSLDQCEQFVPWFRIAHTHAGALRVSLCITRAHTHFHTKHARQQMVFIIHAVDGWWLWAYVCVCVCARTTNAGACVCMCILYIRIGGTCVCVLYVCVLIARNQSFHAVQQRCQNCLIRNSLSELIII